MSRVELITFSFATACGSELAVGKTIKVRRSIQRRGEEAWKGSSSIWGWTKNKLKRFEYGPQKVSSLQAMPLRAVLRDQGLWAKEACEPCPPGRSFGTKACGPKRLASHALRGGPAGPRPAGQNSQRCPLGSKPVGRRGLRAMKACGPKSNCEPCPSGRSFGTAA